MPTMARVICFFQIILLLSFLHSSLSSRATFPAEALPTKSGYLPINSKSKSAIFYTFYEAQNTSLPISQTPLLIWLQGGPGCSSMVGNFFELGPFSVISSQRQNVEHLRLERNSGSWNRIFGLIFLDNPIGVGFSIADTKEEIPRDQNTVAKHLFVAINKFLDLNSEFRNRPLYITGESYAGKYIPAIGYYILKKNVRLPEPKQVNLIGVAIGNGLTDPVNQVKTHALNAYYIGLINERQKIEVEEGQRKAVELAKMGNWSKAAYARTGALDLLQNMTGLATLYDYTKKVPYEKGPVSKFLQSAEVKKALGVDESLVFKECVYDVADALYADIMKSVKHMVEFLVKGIKVLMYHGNFDLRCGVVSYEAWIKTLKWEGIDNYLMAEREIWKVNGDLAGYVQKWGTLSHTLVLGAGHLVPADQSINSQAMIEDWVLGKGLFADARHSDMESRSSS